MQASEGDEWSSWVYSVMDKARERGYLLTPHPEPPYGWDVTKNGQTVKNGKLPDIEAFLAEGQAGT